MSKLLDTIGFLMMFITALCFVGVVICLGVKVYIDWLSAIYPARVHQYFVSLAIAFAIGLIFFLLSKVIDLLERRKVKKGWEKRWH